MTYRNKKLTKLADGQACVSCGTQDGTVVWAHSNLIEHGKGKGIKAHDAAGMMLCSACHHMLDNDKGMSREERREFTLMMIVKTHMVLFEKGLVEVVK